jgi:hypothetical protein
MNLERTVKLGQLASAEKAAKEAAIRIDRLKREMRLYLSEHARPEDLDAAKIQQIADDLLAANGDYHGALTTVRALREELGIDG